jgi:hypothetical protein
MPIDVAAIIRSNPDLLLIKPREKKELTSVEHNRLVMDAVRLILGLETLSQADYNNRERTLRSRGGRRCKRCGGKHVYCHPKKKRQQENSL